MQSTRVPNVSGAVTALDSATSPAPGPTPVSQPGNEPRVLDAIFRAPGPHWVGDGFRVLGYFGAYPKLVKKLSPFLLFDYHAPYDYPATNNLRRGVGPHPHRGFETVTLAFQGSVAHHDSTGSGGVIGPGDVQWMTAASGILHREYHAEAFAKQGGTMQMMQIWVNLPKAHKLSAPGYQGLLAEQMGIVRLPNDAGIVRVVAGELSGTKGPAKTFTPINMFDVQLDGSPERPARFEFALPKTHNLSLLVMRGAIDLADATKGDIKAAENELVVFKNEGDVVSFESTQDAQVLVLSGEPIDEPVVQYGPFVMNTQQEISQAIADFNRGAFGELAD